MHQFLKFILEGNSTCFGQFLCPSSGVFHCTQSNVIYHTGFQTAHEQDQAVPARGPVRNMYSSFQNKFEKLVHQVGFIIRNLSCLLMLFYILVTGISKVLWIKQTFC